MEASQIKNSQQPRPHWFKTFELAMRQTLELELKRCGGKFERVRPELRMHFQEAHYENFGPHYLLFTEPKTLGEAQKILWDLGAFMLGPDLAPLVDETCDFLLPKRGRVLKEEPEKIILPSAKKTRPMMTDWLAKNNLLDEFDGRPMRAWCKLISREQALDAFTYLVKEVLPNSRRHRGREFNPLDIKTCDFSYQAMVPFLKRWFENDMFRALVETGFAQKEQEAEFYGRHPKLKKPEKSA